MDIKFLRDDAAKEREETFSEILSLVKKDVDKEKNILIGERFLYELFIASKNLREKIEKERIAEQFEEVRRVVPKVPVSIPEPQIKKEIIKEFEKKERPKLILEKEEKETVKEVFSRRYSLLVSASDNIVLATASIELVNGRYKYNLIEPNINMEVVQKTKEKIIKKFEKDNKILEDNKYLTKIIKRFCKKFKVEFSDSYFNNVKYYLYRDLLNFGKIDPLLYDKNIISITCQGINKPVIVEYSNLNKIETNVIFMNNEEINGIIKKFANKTGSEVSKDKPVLSTIFNNFRIDANFNNENSTFTIKRIIP